METPNYIPVYVPCKPYIKKWAALKYGPAILASSATTEGLFLTACLRAHSMGAREAKAMAVLSKQGEALLVHLPPCKDPYQNQGISQYHQRLFAQFIETLFKEDLVTFCTPPVTGRYWGYTEALFAFAKKYALEIETDITYETLKKIEQRHRKRRAGVLSQD